MGEEDKIQGEELAFRAKVGDRLRAARKSKNKSLQAVADHFSISKATLGHWETGTNPPDIGRLFRLARYYGVTVSELVADPFTPEQLVAMLSKAMPPKREPEKIDEATPDLQQTGIKRNRRAA